MIDKFATLMRNHRDVVTHIWADSIYDDEETRLAERLSYRQLIDHVPSLLEELGRALDSPVPSALEVAEAARRVRFFVHVRFQQGCLIDEVARELSLLRSATNELLWRESSATTEREWRELREALRRADEFFDELIRQLIVVYAASLRPPVPTQASIWHPSPSRRRRGSSPPTRGE